MTALFNHAFLDVKVVDVVEYKKDKIGWGVGTYSWFILIACSAIFATTATIINQKKVKAEKAEEDRLKELGQNESISEKRKSQTIDQKAAKAQPSIYVQWDLIVNLRGLIYPRRINSSVQVFELMRILAFFWVIWAHEFAYRMTTS